MEKKIQELLHGCGWDRYHTDLSNHSIHHRKLTWFLTQLDLTVRQSNGGWYSAGTGTQTISREESQAKTVLLSRQVDQIKLERVGRLRWRGESRKFDGFIQRRHPEHNIPQLWTTHPQQHRGEGMENKVPCWTSKYVQILICVNSFLPISHRTKNTKRQSKLST